MIITVERRQMHLELALAAARQVPVLHIPLNAESYIPVWDFRYCDDLIQRGYAIARGALENREKEYRSGWRGFYNQLANRFRATRFKRQGFRGNSRRPLAP
jgi:hypothetical protein